MPRPPLRRQVLGRGLVTLQRKHHWGKLAKQRRQGTADARRQAHDAKDAKETKERVIEAKDAALAGPGDASAPRDAGVVIAPGLEHPGAWGQRSSDVAETGVGSRGDALPLGGWTSVSAQTAAAMPLAGPTVLPLAATVQPVECPTVSCAALSAAKYTSLPSHVPLPASITPFDLADALSQLTVDGSRDAAKLMALWAASSAPSTPDKGVWTEPQWRGAEQSQWYGLWHRIEEKSMYADVPGLRALLAELASAKQRDGQLTYAGRAWAASANGHAALRALCRRWHTVVQEMRDASAPWVPSTSPTFSAGPCGSTSALGFSFSPLSSSSSSSSSSCSSASSSSSSSSFSSSSASSLAASVSGSSWSTSAASSDGWLMARWTEWTLLLTEMVRLVHVAIYQALSTDLIRSGLADTILPCVRDTWLLPWVGLSRFRSENMEAWGAGPRSPDLWTAELRLHRATLLLTTWWLSKDPERVIAQLPLDMLAGMLRPSRDGVTGVPDHVLLGALYVANQWAYMQPHSLLEPVFALLAQTHLLPAPLHHQLLNIVYHTVLVSILHQARAKSARLRSITRSGSGALGAAGPGLPPASATTASRSITSPQLALASSVSAVAEATSPSHSVPRLATPPRLVAQVTDYRERTPASAGIVVAATAVVAAAVVTAAQAQRSVVKSWIQVALLDPAKARLLVAQTMIYTEKRRPRAQDPWLHKHLQGFAEESLLCRLAGPLDLAQDKDDFTPTWLSRRRFSTDGCCGARCFPTKKAWAIMEALTLLNCPAIDVELVRAGLLHRCLDALHWAATPRKPQGKNDAVSPSRVNDQVFRVIQCMHRNAIALGPAALLQWTLAVLSARHVHADHSPRALATLIESLLDAFARGTMESFGRFGDSEETVETLDLKARQALLCLLAPLVGLLNCALPVRHSGSSGIGPDGSASSSHVPPRAEGKEEQGSVAGSLREADVADHLAKRAEAPSGAATSTEDKGAGAAVTAGAGAGAAEDSDSQDMRMEGDRPFSFETEAPGSQEALHMELRLAVRQGFGVSGTLGLAEAVCDPVRLRSLMSAVYSMLCDEDIPEHLAHVLDLCSWIFAWVPGPRIARVCSPLDFEERLIALDQQPQFTAWASRALEGLRTLFPGGCKTQVPDTPVSRGAGSGPPTPAHETRGSAAAAAASVVEAFVGPDASPAVQVVHTAVLAREQETATSRTAETGASVEHGLYGFQEPRSTSATRMPVAAATHPHLLPELLPFFAPPV